MILTGKAKKDFICWTMRQSNYTTFSNYLIRYENSNRGNFLWYGNEINLLKEKKFLNSLIIEWFDSVGLNILITCEFDFGYEILDNRYEIEEEVKKWYESRQEAIIEAIKKANELYNLKNK